MSEKIEKIVEEVSTLTALELSELVKAFEDKFGVSAAAPVAAVAVAPGGGGDAGGDAPAAKTNFDVILESAGSSKIPVIKAVREITGLGLKEAKALVDGAPKPIKEGVDSDEAEKIKEQLTAAGATVELK